MLNVALVVWGLKGCDGLLVTTLMGPLDELLEIVLQSSIKLFNSVIKCGIPVVLDGIVRAAIQVVHKLCPLVGRSSLKDEEDPFLSVAPALSLEGWVELVVPSLPALLASSVIKLVSDGVPLLWTMHLDELNELLVFLSVPGALLWLDALLKELLYFALDGCTLVSDSLV